MPRIRSLRPEFWDDEQLAKSTSRDARMLYEGMWTFADEWSRLRGSGDYLKGKVFPYDADLDARAIEALVAELVAAGKVVRYVVAGETYLFVPNLGKHNRLEPDKSASKLPAPPDPNEPALFGIDEVEPRRSSQTSPRQSALYREEGRGSREEGARADAPYPAPSPYCEDHQPGGTEKRCRACGQARERREAWDAQRRERQAREPPCPRHPGEIASNCRLCAAERKGRP